jgi:hypothetical protein
MRHIVRIGWIGLAISAMAGAIGLAFVVGSAIAAGDWDLAPQPWIGIGLALLVPGLAGTAGFALLLDVVLPLRRWRARRCDSPWGQLAGSPARIGVAGSGGPTAGSPRAGCRAG